MLEFLQISRNDNSDLHPLQIGAQNPVVFITWFELN